MSLGLSISIRWIICSTTAYLGSLKSAEPPRVEVRHPHPLPRQQRFDCSYSTVSPPYFEVERHHTPLPQLDWLNVQDIYVQSPTSLKPSHMNTIWPSSLSIKFQTYSLDSLPRPLNNHYHPLSSHNPKWPRRRMAIPPNSLPTLDQNRQCSTRRRLGGSRAKVKDT